MSKCGKDRRANEQMSKRPNPVFIFQVLDVLNIYTWFFLDASVLNFCSWHFLDAKCSEYIHGIFQMLSVLNICSWYFYDT